ncbi:triacylglycerol lipase [Endozoicomonas sp. G2_1]|uniref:lipase family alpha/beta hydrolase n=1 Tax=Endozoicomonas sp. G2_1 TaxID=2821091 RepID=UPI001ADBE306|nr:triacylglycerol lipase [Endozoicomonas sp. G2_1]MBO9490464.1 triacylglycerol lipase [Endozoicomonas sp. G2_1]
MKKLITLLSAVLLLATSVVNAKGYTETKYPIVLVHGIFGFDDVLGVDYFYRVPSALTRSGAKVYVAKVSAANSSELRGEQLLEQVEYVLALTGAEKVNLFGHSQGAQTVRYVASVRPELVASVSSIGGVNWGSKVADVIRGQIEPGSISETVAAGITNGFASLVELFSANSGLPQDAIAGLEVLTTAGSLAFNAKYPEGIPSQYCGEGDMLADNGVYYFSWSGADPFTNIFDPLDGPQLALSLAFDEPNDGLVAACSSHLGKVLKDNYRMNHADEINHSFGIHHFFETDPVTLYRQQANRLRNMGL